MITTTWFNKFEPSLTTWTNSEESAFNVYPYYQLYSDP
jgi:hypothetical protein